MKKLLFLAIASAIAFSTTAQVNIGGLPWSLGESNLPAAENLQLIRPDFEAAAQDDLQAAAGPYRIGLRIPVSYEFESHGTIAYLPAGKKLWRLQLSVPDAMSMDVYFQNFYLPQGVTLFFINENKRQIDGGYDAQSNSDDGIFASPMIEGSTMNIELDIAAGVDISQIRFEIFRVVANYRGGMPAALQQPFGGIGVGPFVPLQDTCDLDAVCPIPAPYYVQIGKSTVHINQGGYICTGNMLNNTAQDCAPLLITSSACMPTYDISDAGFSAWKFYYNLEQPSCGLTSTTTVNRTQFTTGANFRAAGHDNSIPNNSSEFLLLELKDLGNLLKESFQVTYGGWEKMDTVVPAITYPNFSHIGGDAKKFALFAPPIGTSAGVLLSAFWDATPIKGGVGAGSVGSGLFRGDMQRLIGIVSSVGSLGPCDYSSANKSLINRFSYCWTNPVGDGTPAQKLSHWLDPIGSGVSQLNAAPYTPGACGTSIGGPKEQFSSAIEIYPNPSTGIITVRTGFSNQKDVTFEIVNITGKSIGHVAAQSQSNGAFLLDLRSLPNGVYLLRATDGNVSVGKKIILAK